MSREALEQLGLGAGTATVGGRFVQYGALDVSFTDGAPGGVVSSVRVYVARSPGGIRVSGTTLPSNTTYDVLKDAVGACDPAQTNYGASVTMCLAGAVEILQEAPTGELVIGVRQR